MSTITTDNFTKALFHVLGLEWNPHADARHLLSEIIIEEESVDTLMEDIIFSLSQFLDRARESKKISSDSDNLSPYFTNSDSHNRLYIGNSQSSKMVFIITVCGGSYIFQKSLDQDPLEKIHCLDLDELEESLLNYFDVFYHQFKEV